MNNDIILLDGIRYCRYSPKSEDEFERMIVENAGQIFGDEAIYLDIKKKIANALGEGTIPDGFLFYPEQKRFVMVEVELSSHPVYEHISKQVSKFISAFANYRARQKLASMLKEHIEEEPMLAKRVNPLLGTKGLYEFLEFEVFEPLADAKAFEVVVIIEDKTDSVCEALNWLNPRPKLIEAAVYAREGAEADFAVRFEPQYDIVVKQPAQPDSAIQQVDSGRNGIVTSEWTKEEFQSYLKKLGDGGKVVFELLSNAEGAVRKSVIETGLLKKHGWKASPHTVAGILSGILRSLNNNYPGRPYPLKYNDLLTEWEVMLKDEKYRDWIKEALD